MSESRWGIFLPGEKEKPPEVLIEKPKTCEKCGVSNPQEEEGFNLRCPKCRTEFCLDCSGRQYDEQGGFISCPKPECKAKLSIESLRLSDTESASDLKN